ncbi:TrmH family RNA methyltransferase [Hoeflea sp.]
MRLFLCGVQSPINIGMMLRSAEIYGAGVCIWDRYGVLNDPEKLRTISDFACGALQRSPPSVTNDWKSALGRGRCIATDIDPDCPAHVTFSWRRTDQILIGNEYDGIPLDILARATERVTIPMPAGHFPKPKSNSPIDPNRAGLPRASGKPSLNTAIAASVLLSTAYAVCGV